MISSKDKILFLNLDFSKSKASVKDTMAGLGEIYTNPEFKMPITDFIVGATIFSNQGYNLSVIDNELEKKDDSQLLKEIKQGEYKMIFVRTSLPNFKRDLLFVAKLKKEIEEIKICLFGPFLNNLKEELGESSLDYWVSGESEFVFLDIIRQLPLEQIKGLSWRKEKEFFSNNERGYDSDLNLLPAPQWDLVDYKKYSFITCLTSKGCPYCCGYCPYPVYQGRKWRSKKVDLVIEELRKDFFDYKINYLRFRDPEFTIDRQRIVDLCKKIKENRTLLKWHCETRLDLLDRELLGIMKGAGCEEISFGVETINEETRKIINRRKVAEEKIKEVLEACQDLEIKTFGFFIIGLPGETKKTSLELIKLSLDLNTYLNEFTLATPYLGTPLRQWAKERNFLINKDYSLYTGREVIMNNGLMTNRQLKTLCRFANSANQRKFRKKQKSKKSLKRIIYYFLRDLEYYYLKFKIKLI